MDIVNPHNIVLSSTNAETSTAAEYNSGTTYGLSEVVQISASHRLYESLVAGNVGNNPPDTLDTKWLDLGATNDYAMFDEYMNTKTESEDNLSVTFPVNLIDKVILFGVEGTSVTIRLRESDESGAEILWETTIDILYSDPNVSSISNWAEYFFNPDPLLDNDLIADVGSYAYNGLLEISIDYLGGVAKCAKVVVGKSQFIGKTRYGIEIGITDFSKIITDSYGRMFVQEGNYSNRNTVSIIIDNNLLDGVKKLLTTLRAKPVVYIGAKSDIPFYQSLLLFGLCKRFTPVIEAPEVTICQMEVNGFI